MRGPNLASSHFEHPLSSGWRALQTHSARLGQLIFSSSYLNYNVYNLKIPVLALHVNMSVGSVPALSVTRINWNFAVLSSSTQL